MYDPYGITQQSQQPVQQPVAVGTMNPNMSPQDEAARRQKMMMLTEALRGMQPQQPVTGGDVTPATGNLVGTALGSFGNTLSLGK